MEIPTRVGGGRVEILNCIRTLSSLDGEPLLNTMKVKHLMSIKQPGLCTSTGRLIQARAETASKGYVWLFGWDESFIQSFMLVWLANMQETSSLYKLFVGDEQFQSPEKIQKIELSTVPNSESINQNHQLVVPDGSNNMENGSTNQPEVASFFTGSE